MVAANTLPVEQAQMGNDDLDVVAARARAIPQCAAGKTVNLKRYVSIHPFFVVKKLLVWLLLGLICLAFNRLILPNYSLFTELNSSVFKFLTYTSRLGLLLPFFAWWYWEEYRKHIELRIEGFRLVSVTGVFLKKVDSRPLAQICAVTVDQSLLAQFVDLFEVRLYCLIGFMARPYISFPSLSQADALVIEEYLNLQMSRLIAPTSEALELERTRSQRVH